MRHVSALLVPGFGRPVLLCRGKMPRARGMAAYVRDGYGAFRQNKFECGCCEMLFFRVCGVRKNLYVYSLYRNPDLDHWIFDCLKKRYGQEPPSGESTTTECGFNYQLLLVIYRSSPMGSS